MADQNSSKTATGSGTEDQIGSTVSTEGGASLTLDLTNLAAAETLEVYHKESINGTEREAPHQVYLGANCPKIVKYGPIETPASAALKFFFKQSGTGVAFGFRIEEY